MLFILQLSVGEFLSDFENVLELATWLICIRVAFFHFDDFLALFFDFVLQVADFPGDKGDMFFKGLEFLSHLHVGHHRLFHFLVHFRCIFELFFADFQHFLVVLF